MHSPTAHLFGCLPLKLELIGYAKSSDESVIWNTRTSSSELVLSLLNVCGQPVLWSRCLWSTSCWSLGCSARFWFITQESWREQTQIRGSPALPTWWCRTRTLKGSVPTVKYVIGIASIVICVFSSVSYHVLDKSAHWWFVFGVTLTSFLLLPAVSSRLHQTL